MSYKVVLTGDSIIARTVSQHQDVQTQKLYELIRQADVAFTNLEVVPCDFKGDPAARSDGAHFGTASAMLDDLQALGFNLYSCANNHALDYGVSGLLEAMAQLKKRGMAYAGIGKHLAEARQPVYMTTDKVTVALISCSSTYFDEQAAGAQRDNIQGRPGLNPLKFEVEYVVKESHFTMLHELFEEFGLKKHLDEFRQLGFDREVIDDTVLKFADSNHRVAGTLNAKFKKGETNQVRTHCNAKDLADITKYVAEAKQRADLVIVSLHAHEYEATRFDVDHYIPEFCHHVIDNGADIVVGHGPHLLRGIELYNGKPIFYSLGNFIGQNELIELLPEDSYKRFNVPSTILPSEIFNIRCDYGKKGFPGDPVYWISVMPELHYDGQKLTALYLRPLELTRGEKGYQRGRPMLASGDKAEDVYTLLTNLSEKYGTIIKKRTDECFEVVL